MIKIRKKKVRAVDDAGGEAVAGEAVEGGIDIAAVHCVQRELCSRSKIAHLASGSPPGRCLTHIEMHIGAVCGPEARHILPPRGVRRDRGLRSIG